MKHILGLDLGTTSIGFAHVIEGNTPEESEIKQIGVRLTQLDNFVSTKTGKESKEPLKDFFSGRGISPNAGRTKKRSARRNLDRYQDRRRHLIAALKNAGIINDDTVLKEDGGNTTHQTWALRAKAAVESIEKDELARVFLAINKKRGYKSNRKIKNDEDGTAIDGMEVAKKLYEENLTPGQYVYHILRLGKKFVPVFYRSDLQVEFDRVWNFQKQHYPDIFTDEFYAELQGKGLRATSDSFWKKYQFNIAENKGKSEEKRMRAYKWRSEAVSKQLEKEEVAHVLTDINNNLYNSNDHLGAISDRSKELFFNKLTVGQYLYRQLQESRHTSLKKQVFYRQDYLDEFEKIWEVQSRYYPELTNELKIELRDIIIFYQRKLKSQKGLLSFCELEQKEISFDGIKRIIGPRVAPKSSPLFQEFKIWQNLNNVVISKKNRSAKTLSPGNFIENKNNAFVFDLETKQFLFDELNLKGNLKAAKIIELVGCKPSEWEINYTELEGNRTNKELYKAYLKILEIEGYDVKKLLKVKSDEDEVELDKTDIAASEIKTLVKDIFGVLDIDVNILEFDAELDGKAFEKQQAYQLWHLLYSYEGDDSKSGNERLYELLKKKFGFDVGGYNRLLKELQQIGY